MTLLRHATASRSRPGWAFSLFGGTAAAALTWAQFRGVDVLDAATHFLTYQHPADNPDKHTYYYLLARPLWLLVGGNIVVFRLLTLALISGAVWVFWRSWRPQFGTAGELQGAALALWLSAVAGLAWLPVVLGYNSLSTFFALLALAALAAALTWDGDESRRPAIRCVCGLAFVGLAGVTAVVKPPAALALFFWGGLLALVFLPLPRLARWAIIATLTGTAVSILAWLSHWNEQIREDPTAMLRLAWMQLRPHWVFATLERYAAELGVFLPTLARDLAWMAAPALALPAGILLRARNRDAASPWASAAIAAFFIGLLAVATIRGLWDGSFSKAVSGEMARLYLVLWGSLFPAWLLIWLRAPAQQTRPGILALTLLGLPLTCGFGSTNTLYFSALHWTVFWAAGLLIVSREVASALGEPRFHRMFTGVLILTAASHLFTGHFWKPYMHQPPLWRQNTPVAVGHPATTLKLDAATAGFLNEVRDTLGRNGYQPGEDVFGFFNLPGVIFAIGAKQPGAPWYFGTWYGGDDTDGGKIRAVPRERRQRAWIITQADVTHFRREFLNCGIDFPDGYEKIGRTTNPTTGLEIGIWKPKSRR